MNLICSCYPHASASGSNAGTRPTFLARVTTNNHESSTTPLLEIFLKYVSALPRFLPSERSSLILSHSAAASDIALRLEMSCAQYQAFVYSSWQKPQHIASSTYPPVHSSQLWNTLLRVTLDRRLTFREFNTELRPFYGRLDMLRKCKSAADELNNNVSVHLSFRADLPCRCIAQV